MKMFFILSTLLMLASCATHPLMQGSVALKIDEKNGIACMNTKKLQVGSKLNVSNNNCSRVPLSKNEPAYCQLVTAGEIEITKVLNDHYSEFQTLGDFKFSEGSILNFN